MIALLLAALLVSAITPPTAPPDVPPLRTVVTPAKVLARYAAALAMRVAPRAISFEYTLEQTGARDLLQTHRVFRSGTDQRDEILAVDGRKLDPPAVRITHGRRDRYDLALLAPKTSVYDFRLIGLVRDARHEDYVFATTPHAPEAFRITTVTIDGSSFLPASIAFETQAHGGSGTLAFGRAEKYWVPTIATARATYAKLGAQERITFQRYRFPSSLPPSTFAQPRRPPPLRPET